MAKPTKPKSMTPERAKKYNKAVREWEKERAKKVGKGAHMHKRTVYGQPTTSGPLPTKRQKKTTAQAHSEERFGGSWDPAYRSSAMKGDKKKLSTHALLEERARGKPTTKVHERTHKSSNGGKGQLAAAAGRTKGKAKPVKKSIKKARKRGGGKGG